MSRLRNRMTKADFWTDPDLLAWPRDKRFFYMGLRSLAEDSGCLEDSPFGWMCVLYCSPLDRDISIETVTAWRDELIADGKLIPYTIAGKHYLYQTTFHAHEHPRNPQKHSFPLPPWIRWIKNTDDARKGHYEVDDPPPTQPQNTDASLLQGSYNDATTLPAQPRPAPPRPVLKSIGGRRASAGGSDDDFNEWWSAYGKIGSKADASRLYRFWRGKGAGRVDLLTAAGAYRIHCERTDCKMQHARTFLAKPPKGERARWSEWAEGEEHGSMDVAGDGDLAAVLRAGAQTYGGNNGGHRSVREPDQPARPLGRGKDDRLGLPAQRLEQGD